MIKGKGHEFNFLSIEDDISKLITLRENIRNIETQLKPIHDAYQVNYDTCPMPSVTLSEDLVACYRALSEKLKETYYEPVSSNFCCYCGRNEPDRLDHFHPSSKAPQFSLLRQNLIRSCVKCNEHKLNRLPISVLKLFHPYFSPVFQNHDYLFKAILNGVGRGRDGKLIFDVDVVPVSGLSSQEELRVSAVLRELKIKKRVANRIAIKLTNVTNDWYGYGVNMDRRREFLFLASRAQRESNYTDFFSYSILADLRSYGLIDALI